MPADPKTTDVNWFRGIRPQPGDIQYDPYVHQLTDEGYASGDYYNPFSDTYSNVGPGFDRAIDYRDEGLVPAGGVRPQVWSDEEIRAQVKPMMGTGGSNITGSGPSFSQYLGANVGSGRSTAYGPSEWGKNALGAPGSFGEKIFDAKIASMLSPLTVTGLNPGYTADTGKSSGMVAGPVAGKLDAAVKYRSAAPTMTTFAEPYTSSTLRTHRRG